MRDDLPKNAAAPDHWEQSLPGGVVFALKRLEDAGFEAALVGGCVRDRLMGRAPGDYDMTTSATPEEMLRVFADTRTIPTGLKHGTLTVLHEGTPIEITTFREDGEYIDLRRPESVRFTRSLREDVLRRDFTMNALAWERKKGVIDYVGGMRDIENGIIRAVGEPKRRFSEDALRILRAVRFAAQLGFEIERETAKAALELRENVDKIAAERVKVEFEKLLRGAWAEQVLWQYCEILRPRIACALSDEQWAASCARIGRLRGKNLPLLWAALLMDVGAERAQEALTALRADNATMQGAGRRILAAQEDLSQEYMLRKLCGKFGAECVRDAIWLKNAGDERLLDRIIAEKRPCAVGDLAVSGRDLMALGLRGKEIGAALDGLLEQVLRGMIPNERESLLRRI